MQASRILLIFMAFATTTSIFSATHHRTLFVDSTLIKKSSALAMVVKKGDGKFDNALAMNIPYAPFKDLHKEISNETKLNLKIFRGWDPDGEAHLTVITPVEYYDMLKQSEDGSPLISMDEIAEIARQHEIQKSDLAILGIGRGQALVNGVNEETYFMVVESMNLRKIRQAIYNLYVRKGGNAKKWNPQHFFPHITIGFTERDLHEADGVLKNMEHSFDDRFDIELN